MSIQALSDELFTRIIEFVAEVPETAIYHRQKTLWGQLGHTQLVSRRFYAIATPILHHTFVENKDDSISLFLRALFRREPATLETSIKRFVSMCGYNTSDNPMEAWTDADFDLAGAVLRDVSSDEIATKWMAALRSGDLDALSGLALLLLPNLEELTFSQYSNDLGDNDNFYVSYALDKASLYQEENRISEPWSLAKLREVSLAYADTENGMYIITLAPFLKLKLVKRFSAYAVADEEFQTGGNKFYAEDLELNYSCIAGSCMISFLSCFPNLKRVKYEIGGPTVGDHDFSPQAFGTAIRSLEHCLEEFIIEGYLDNPNLGDDPEHSLPFGSFKGFKKLRKIVCRSAMLLGDPEITADFHMNDDDSDHDENQETPVTEMSLVDVIPKSLRQLTLSDCGGGSELDYLRELLIRSEELELEISFIEFDFGGNEYDTEEARALTRDCKAAGITFVHR